MKHNKTTLTLICNYNFLEFSATLNYIWIRRIMLLADKGLFRNVAMLNKKRLHTPVLREKMSKLTEALGIRGKYLTLNNQFNVMNEISSLKNTGLSALSLLRVWDLSTIYITYYNGFLVAFIQKLPLHLSKTFSLEITSLLRS